MRKRIAKLIDVKSIITIGLVVTLIIVTLSGKGVDEKIFNLFSNVVTMVVTYFFTRNNSDKQENEDNRTSGKGDEKN